MQRLVSASARGTRSAAIALAGVRRPLSVPSKTAMASTVGGQRQPLSSSPSSPSSFNRRPSRWNVSRASSSPVGGVGGVGGSGGGSGGGGSGGFGGSSGSGDDSSSFFSRLSELWPAYLALLSERPLQTKSATAAVLNAAGDACAQLLIEGRRFFGDAGEGRGVGSRFDWARLGRFSLLGGVLVGPALHWWYGTLASVVSFQGTAGALSRLALDQVAFAPVFIGSFFASLGLLEGKTFGQICDKLRSDLPATVRSNWLLWVPANFVNFRFVPVPLQVAFSNFVALFWNTYVSFVSNKS